MAGNKGVAVSQMGQLEKVQVSGAGQSPGIQVS